MNHPFLRTFMQTAAALAFTLTAPALADIHVTHMKGTQAMSLTGQWDKILPKSDKVEHRKITFKNRYGITLAGDLYMPKKHPPRPEAACDCRGRRIRRGEGAVQRAVRANNGRTRLCNPGV